jgi:hypothetical protein
MMLWPTIKRQLKDERGSHGPDETGQTDGDTYMTIPSRGEERKIYLKKRSKKTNYELK